MQKMGDINGVFRRFFRMVLVAQLARASGCGPEGRRFEPDRAHPPDIPVIYLITGFFLFGSRKIEKFQ